MKHIIRNHLRRRAIVTTHDGQGFSGVLYDADTEAVILREAEALDLADGTRVAVDGELLILRTEVAYIQLP